MKIAILYNRDLYALKALNLLLPPLAGHEVALFHSSRVGRCDREEPAPLQRLHRAERAVLDMPGGAELEGYLGFAALARAHGCADNGLNHVNQPQGMALLRAFAPDLMLSIRFGRILKAPAIAIPALGILNLHSGVLPAYRGVMPTFWAMLAGDATIGMTLHWICDASIDTGPPVAIVTRALERGRSYMNQVWKLYETGVPAMTEAVTRIARGELAAPRCAPPATEDHGRYFTFPDAAALDAFEREGFELFSEKDLASIGRSFRHR